MGYQDDLFAMLLELVAAWIAIDVAIFGIPFLLSSIPFWFFIFLVVFFIYPYITLMFYMIDHIFNMIHSVKIKILSSISLIVLAYYNIDKICNYDVWNDYEFNLQGILIIALMIVLAVLFFGRYFYVKLKKA